MPSSGTGSGSLHEGGALQGPCFAFVFTELHVTNSKSFLSSWGLFYILLMSFEALVALCDLVLIQHFTSMITAPSTLWVNENIDQDLPQDRPDRTSLTTRGQAGST